MNNRRLSEAICFLLVLVNWLPGQTGTYTIQTDRKLVTGTPLVWDSQRLFLVTGYGDLTEISVPRVKAFKKQSAAAAVHARDAFVKKMQQEFGPRYQVSTTTDYVIVHPQGQRDFWPGRIQSVYTSFQNYFQGRQITLRNRQFPLVAVILGSRSEFEKYAQRNNEQVGRNVVGYYSPTSNRVVLYDQSGRGNLWEHNFDTIVHEIAHQAAFNRGIHSRFGDTPRWAIEGLGTMFEARGVYNSLKYTRQVDRINPGLFDLFHRKVLAVRSSGWIGPVLLDNRLFGKDPEFSYSAAWALTFYLVETHPHEYISYLKRLAKLPPMEKYSPESRLADFQRAFGDLNRLEGAIQNYLSRFRRGGN